MTTLARQGTYSVVALATMQGGNDGGQNDDGTSTGNAKAHMEMVSVRQGKANKMTMLTQVRAIRQWWHGQRKDDARAKQYWRRHSQGKGDAMIGNAAMVLQVRQW